MFEIRTITDDDVDLFRRRVSRGFGGDHDSDEAAAERFAAVFEYDRLFAAFDGDDIVGTGGALSFGLTVPGGAEVAMGGTTIVTVQPTHRRRGVLRSIMDAHLDEIAGRGEPVAGLWASESAIYGRFGYGPATYSHIAELDANTVEFLEEPAKGSVRLVESDEASTIAPAVYEQARPTRAGMLTRHDAWWTHRLIADPESRRGGNSARRYLAFEEGDAVSGYVAYRQKGKWEDWLADGQVEVSEVITTTSAAHTGIWAYLTNVDLFPNVEWWNMPVDDELPMKVTDPRRIKRRLSDALWLRIMDVPSALTARQYEYDGVITFAVSDPTKPDNSGTYRLEVADGVGSCERVSSNADLAFETDVLGSLYLGGGDALGLARAGRIEGDPRAVTTLHRMFRTDRAPWCPEIF